VALTNLKEHKEKKFVDISREDLELGKLWSALYLELRIFSVSASLLIFSLLNSAICNNFLHRFSDILEDLYS
jgi:hypothetical protein